MGGGSYIRKPHYVAESCMLLSWGLDCGFNAFLPYFMWLFVLMVHLHRQKRDAERMKNKYGADWDRYCQTVPYIFIPYIY